MGGSFVIKGHLKNKLGTCTTYYVACNGGGALVPPGSTGPAIIHTIVIKMMKVLEKELRPNQTPLCSIIVKRYVSKWHNEPELKFPT